MKVLIVDDEEFNRDIIRGYIEDEGFESIESENGKQGLKMLEKHPDVSLILLDRMMPEMDGMEFIKKQKSDERFKNIPVIMQTAIADTNSIAEGINSGVYYYLTKPYNENLLLSIVRAAINDARHKNELINEVVHSKETLGFLQKAEFQIKTREQAQSIALVLANGFPDPQRVILGISEILINAVEHGNLGISYEEKRKCMMENTYEKEIERRQKSPKYNKRMAKVVFSKNDEEVSVLVKDEGKGFNWSTFTDLDSTRVEAPNGRGILMAQMISFDFLKYNEKGNEALCGIKLTK